MAEREGTAGGAIVRASFAGTAVLILACAAGVADADTLGVVTAGVGVAMLAVGSVLFLWAYGIAVNRSRTDAIGIGGLYFLAGSAPRPVRVRLLGSFFAQVVVAVVAASIRPYTNLAFSVLAPVYGLALCGLWAARYGTFPARNPSPKGGRRTGASPSGRRTDAPSGGAPGQQRAAGEGATAGRQSAGRKGEAAAGGPASAGRRRWGGAASDRGAPPDSGRAATGDGDSTSERPPGTADAG